VSTSTASRTASLGSGTSGDTLTGVATSSTSSSVGEGVIGSGEAIVMGKVKLERLKRVFQTENLREVRGTQI